MGDLTNLIPTSRQRLYPKLRAYAEALSGSLDRISQAHQLASELLADWLVAHYQPGKPLDVIIVCTGNSRRSILGSMMGNVAAAYADLPEIRFQSGGTDPTACNPRTVHALRAIGVEITPTGSEAVRGEPETANPIYQIRWGTLGEASAPPLEMAEFSKRYDDPANPGQGFAAVMVCHEADTGCPTVQGAALRLSMPYEDPKAHDGTAHEAHAYAERRDDIGRAMLSTLMQVRQRLIAVGTSVEGTP